MVEVQERGYRGRVTVGRTDGIKFNSGLGTRMGP